MNVQTKNSTASSLSPAEWQALAQEIQQTKRLRAERNRLIDYHPYAKQAEFHKAGATFDERLFMAGNQLGKTLAGGFEWAIHLTGRYPDWWVGRRFNEPVRMWAAGVTGESTRDNPQRILLGPPQQEESWGTGAIPKECIKLYDKSRGVPNAIDSVVVKHKSGGESVLSFKAYEKGREKWQGETLHGVWFDEEPPLDIYSEGKTRVMATSGIVIVTFTPLQSMTEVVKLFLSDADIEAMRKRHKA